MDLVRRSARVAIRLRARDVTTLADQRTALIIAPHPDDETLGCGGTVLRKLAAGSQVTILVVTDGRHSHTSRHLPPEQLAALRRREMAEAARRLGVPPDALRWVGLVDGTVTDNEDRLVRVIAEVLAERRPQEVYATCAGEPHPDHAAVSRAARRAVREAAERPQLFEYPVWLWSAWPVRRPDRLRSTVDAASMAVRRGAVSVCTREQVPAKMQALGAHASQLQRPGAVPDDEEWQGLPTEVLSAASDRVEIFFPVRRYLSVSYLGWLMADSYAVLELAQLASVTC